MPLIGDYDPAGYVTGDYATYPPLPDGDGLYQPSMWWNSTGTGTMDGHPVQPTDRIYVVGKGRTYGEWLYGDLVYGGPAGYDWPVELVTWVIWSDEGQPPNWVDPYPFTGCPLGDYAPDWRIVIDAYYNDAAGSRTYGELNYGDEVYGDPGAGTPGWHELTREAFAVNVTVGTSDGSDVVPVTELILDLWDDDATTVDISPVNYFTVRLDSPVRVGVFDPGWKYHPLAAGVVRAIEDTHDTLPRYVTITAFGADAKLSTSLANWQRPSEMLSARVRALLAAALYPLDDLHDYPRDTLLSADVKAGIVNARAEMDRTAMSGGMSFDTTPRADLRMRDWPLTPTETVLRVVDCITPDTEGALLSGSIGFSADDAELLNNVIAANNTEPPTVAQAMDSLSVGTYGPFTEAMGFPRADLAFTDVAAATAWCQRVADRYGLAISRANDITADTDLDPAWVPWLADLDTGQAISVERTELIPFKLDGLVVGFEHRIIRDRWQTTLHTDTITRTT